MEARQFRMYLKNCCIIFKGTCRLLSNKLPLSGKCLSEIYLYPTVHKKYMINNVHLSFFTTENERLYILQITSVINILPQEDALHQLVPRSIQVNTVGMDPHIDL